MNKKQKTKWLEDRKTALCGSDIAPIMGLSPFQSPMDIWMQKTGKADSQPENEAMYWGNTLEPVVAKEYAKRNNCKIQKGKFTRSAQREWAAATPDYLSADDENKGIEIKTSGSVKGWADGIPDYYLVQIAWYGIVTERQLWDVAALLKGNQYVQHAYTRMPALEAVVLEKAEEFWMEHVVKDIPPAVDGSDTYKNYLEQKFSESNDQIVMASADALPMFDELHRYEQEAKQLKEKIELHKNQVRDLIGFNNGVEGAFGKVTWKTQEGSERVDLSALRAAHPDLVSQFTKKGDKVRVLRFHWAKEE